MAIRKLNPITPGTRGMSVSEFDEITCTTPEKSLLAPLKKTGGRTSTVTSPFVTSAAAKRESTE